MVEATRRSPPLALRPLRPRKASETKTFKLRLLSKRIFYMFIGRLDLDAFLHYSGRWYFFHAVTSPRFRIDLPNWRRRGGDGEGGGLRFSFVDEKRLARK